MADKILLTDALKPRAKWILQSVANLTRNWKQGRDLYWNSYTVAEGLDGVLQADKDVYFYRDRSCGGTCYVRFYDVDVKKGDGDVTEGASRVLARKTIDRQTAMLRNDSDSMYTEEYTFTLSETTGIEKAFETSLEVAIKQGIEAGGEGFTSTTELSTSFKNAWSTKHSKEETKSRTDTRTFHLHAHQSINVEASRAVAETEQDFEGALDFIHAIDVYSERHGITYTWHSVEDFIAAASGHGARNLWLAGLFAQYGGISEHDQAKIREVPGGDLKWTGKFDDVGALDVQVKNLD